MWDERCRGEGVGFRVSRERCTRADLSGFKVEGLARFEFGVHCYGYGYDYGYDNGMIMVMVLVNG